jgi:hypothetical protein
MVSRLFQILTLLAATVLVGCNVEKEAPKEEGINIQFPGGSVKVGQDGVDVQAPGTSVKVDENKKVDVEAPSFQLKLESGKSSDQ